MEKSNVMNYTFRDLIRPIFRQKVIMLVSFIVITASVYIGLLFQTPVYEARVLINIKVVSQIAAATYERIGAFRIHLTQLAIVKSNPVIKRAVKALGLNKKPLDYEKNFCHPLKDYLIDYRIQKEKKYIASLSPTEREEYLMWKAMIELKESIETRLQPNTDLFEIVVRDYDATKAVEIANVVSRAYTIYDLQQQLAELTLKYGDLHPTIQQLQDNIHKMSNTLTGKEIPDLDAMGTASVKIIEQASTDYKAVGRPKLILFLTGIVISLFVGLALAFVFDLLNHTVKSPDEIVKFLDIPDIGTIPKKRLIKGVWGKDIVPGTTYSEFYNDLADQMFIFMKVQNLKSLLFMSVSPHTINAEITARVGYCLSQNMGLKVLIIDANFTKHTINKLLRFNDIPGMTIKVDEKELSKLDEMPGLTNLLENKVPDAGGLIYQMDAKLHILPAGRASETAASLLNESKIKSIIQKFADDYDAVLVDCSLMKKVTEITIFSTSVDGTVVIISEGKDHIQVTRKVLHVLKQNRGKIIGGILNNRTFPIPRWLYKNI